MSNPKSREFPSRKDGSSGSIRNSSGSIKSPSGKGKKSPFQQQSVLIFGGIGLGVLLIVIIAISMSGGSPPPRDDEVTLRRPPTRVAVAPPTAVPASVAPTTPRVTPRTNTVS